MLSSQDQESRSASCYSSKILESSLSLGRSLAITFSEKDSGGPHVAITQGGNRGVRGKETSLLSGCGIRTKRWQQKRLRRLKRCRLEFQESNISKRDHQRMAGLNEHSMKRSVDEGKVAFEASQTQNTLANDQDGGPPMDQTRRLLAYAIQPSTRRNVGVEAKAGPGDVCWTLMAEVRMDGGSITDSAIQDMNMIFLTNHEGIIVKDIWEMGKAVDATFNDSEDTMIDHIRAIEERDREG
ncbi:hypothetical protein Ancab_019222 [Ancistrocladus abbreviatus]